MITTATRTAQATPCPGCGETVLTARKSGRDILLDTDRGTGGVYELVGNRVTRRPLLDLSIEFREHQPVRGGGFDVHTCPEPEHWSSR